MDIQHLVDRLEQVLNESSRLPLSAYLMVNEDRIYNIIDQMRVAVPEEVKRANRIESEKDRILAQAKEEADRIRELAKQEAGELVKRDAITLSAQQRAGYPFGTPGSGVRGADAPGEVDEAGDLPEAAYFAKSRGFWRHDEEDAVREAKRTGRGLLVSFWADWSVECTQLDESTLRDPTVRAEIFGDYVPLRIDVSEETRLGRVQLERYRVDHVPAIILLDVHGRELDRIDSFVSDELILDRLRARKTASQ